MLVNEIMKKPLVIEKDMSLKKAADLMKKYDISSLVVMNKDKIVGIITHEDLVENFSERKKVSSVMTKDVVVIYEKDRSRKAMDLIKENKISILPVVDGKGKLVGIIDAKDLLNESCSTDDFLMN